MILAIKLVLYAALGVLLANDIGATTMGRFEPRADSFKKMREKVRKAAGLYEVVYK